MWTGITFLRLYGRSRPLILPLRQMKLLNLTLRGVQMLERLPDEIRTIPNRINFKRNIHGLLLA